VTEGAPREGCTADLYLPGMQALQKIPRDLGPCGEDRRDPPRPHRGPLGTTRCRCSELARMRWCWWSSEDTARELAAESLEALGYRVLMDRSTRGLLT